MAGGRWPELAGECGSHPCAKLGQVLAGSNLPGHSTPLPGAMRYAQAVFFLRFLIVWAYASRARGLYICGDSTSPGIGVPSAAMSGHICADLSHFQLESIRQAARHP